jgi:hypothetical protein
LDVIVFGIMSLATGTTPAAGSDFKILRKPWRDLQRWEPRRDRRLDRQSEWSWWPVGVSCSWTVRFPKVLGMFVLGLWLVRRGIAVAPEAHRETLIRWRRIGLLAGLPANVIGTWAFSQWPYLPPSFGGLLGVVSQAIGFPLLAIGYSSTIRATGD